MPKLILLPITGRDADGPGYAAALVAAQPFKAHIVALHVRPDVQREVAGLAAADMGMAAGLEATLNRLEQEADRREQEAAAAWRAFAAGNALITTDHPGCGDGVSTEFLTETGEETDWVAAHGRVADLVVTGRGAGALRVAEAVLLHTGRPVLIAPATDRTSSLDGTVAIAWKDGREAARAVAAALPFIRRARRVLVFSVDEGSETPDRSPARLAHALRWHNPNVAVKLLARSARPAAEALLAAAGELGCGLLVMGGYSHGRLREAMFGGFTRAVLDDAALPVLMAH
jgi:nucleotide-binding universal stress UspA family protein